MENDYKKGQYCMKKKFLMMCMFLGILGCVQTEKPTHSTLSKVPAYDNTFPIGKQGDSIVLTWKRPSVNPDSVAYYELFYRTVEDSNWNLLKRNIPAAGSPSVTVYRKDIDAAINIFYFAVRSITKNGMKSEFNYSNDSSASPMNWYFRWDNGSKK